MSVHLNKNAIVYEQTMDALKELLPASQKTYAKALGTYYEVMNDFFDRVYDKTIKDPAAKERKYRMALSVTKKSIDFMVLLHIKIENVWKKSNGKVDSAQWKEINDNGKAAQKYNNVVAAYVEELRACIDDPEHYQFPKFGDPKSRELTPLYSKMVHDVNMEFEEIDKDQVEYDFVEECPDMDEV